MYKTILCAFALAFSFSANALVMNYEIYNSANPADDAMGYLTFDEGLDADTNSNPSSYTTAVSFGTDPLFDSGSLSIISRGDPLGPTPFEVYIDFLMNDGGKLFGAYEGLDNDPISSMFNPSLVLEVFSRNFSLALSRQSANGEQRNFGIMTLSIAKVSEPAPIALLALALAGMALVRIRRSN